jgi:hypothetical protein
MPQVGLTDVILQVKNPAISISGGTEFSTRFWEFGGVANPRECESVVMIFSLTHRTAEEI